MTKRLLPASVFLSLTAALLLSACGKKEETPAPSSPEVRESESPRVQESESPRVQESGSPRVQESSGSPVTDNGSLVTGNGSLVTGNGSLVTGGEAATAAAAAYRAELGRQAETNKVLAARVGIARAALASREKTLHEENPAVMAADAEIATLEKKLAEAREKLDALLAADEQRTAFKAKLDEVEALRLAAQAKTMKAIADAHKKGLHRIPAPVRESESPEVRESESPEVRESESPEVRESESPEVRESESPEPPAQPEPAN